MILDVSKFGAQVLREKGAYIKNFDVHLKQFAEKMLETMYANNGIGLAAPQVGKSLMICVIDVRSNQDETSHRYIYDGRKVPVEFMMPLIMINPELKLIADVQICFEEGCLSFPNIRGEVIRPEKIDTHFQDVNGSAHQLECGGLLSRVIQHEVDHLNGVLFIDRMHPDVLRTIKTKVKQLKRRTPQKYQAKA
jgi:peptide deformylase